MRVLEDHWPRAVKAAGIERHMPLKNGTRHSLGMQLRNQQGWSIENIALRLGHSGHGVTAKYYAQGELELIRALVDGKTVAKWLPTEK